MGTCLSIFNKYYDIIYFNWFGADKEILVEALCDSEMTVIYF